MPENYAPAQVTVCLQPAGHSFTMPRPKTVRQLLERLGLRQDAALIIRDGGLLTPDRRIEADDSLVVRVVTSSG
ncbi:hypothetical protein LJB82_01260 [Desulfovibrio sp. OttesenSCG-928-M16]|nr:hypothetical protein [Desulfovibrio sp. OttesenSCG-928-M16]